MKIERTKEDQEIVDSLVYNKEWKVESNRLSIRGYPYNFYLEHKKINGIFSKRVPVLEIYSTNGCIFSKKLDYDEAVKIQNIAIQNAEENNIKIKLEILKALKNA